MSKEQEARVRDELLQQLYASVLRCTLTAAQVGKGRGKHGGEAMAAGICASLRPTDVLLLPKRGGLSFRALRGVAGATHATSALRDLTAGVLVQPEEEGAAVALAVGVATALAHTAQGGIATVLLPADAWSARAPRPRRQLAWPRTWADAADHAARLGLPLLLLAAGPRVNTRGAGKQDEPHRLPAPLYPTVPVDRVDALAMYRAGFECITRARAGGGPSGIVGVPFHVRGTVAEDESALARLEAALRKRAAFQKAWKRTLEHEIVTELTAS